MRLHELFKAVDEITNNTSTNRDDASRYDFDEFIDVAKPTGKTIGGYEIHVEDNGNTKVFLVKANDDDGYLGSVELTKLADYWQSQASFAEEIQGKGIALPLYLYLLNDLGLSLVSDGEHSPGGKSLWNKIAKQPGINVYVWRATDYKVLGAYTPDREAEVYGDKTKYNIRLIATTKALTEDKLKLPDIEVGDEIKVGKFKNRKATVTGFDKDDHNQPVLKTTKGDQKLFKPRLTKLEKDTLKECPKR